ncbi:MAG TPA: circadian clock KaiB family protein [Candidatus Sabulitectum sp.]|nr:circadian clock KaiB family protein [Candidatus Sabulitectum sp.]
MTFDSSTGTIRLFIAGKAPNSIIALDNLHRLLDRAGISWNRVHIVDVMEHPEEALDRGVFITPALLLGSGDSTLIIYGNLTKTRELDSIFGTDLEANA